MAIAVAGHRLNGALERAKRLPDLRVVGSLSSVGQSSGGE
jgi:hypothetical protein